MNYERYVELLIAELESSPFVNEKALKYWTDKLDRIQSKSKQSKKEVK